jgi:hypothetical protein
MLVCYVNRQSNEELQKPSLDRQVTENQVQMKVDSVRQHLPDDEVK